MIDWIVDFVFGPIRFVQEVLKYNEQNRKKGHDGIGASNLVAMIVLCITGAVLIWKSAYMYGIGCVFAGLLALFLNGAGIATIIRYLIVGTLIFITTFIFSFTLSMLGLAELGINIWTIAIAIICLIASTLLGLPEWIEKNYF